MTPPTTYLDVRFDVTNLTPEQRGRLAMVVSVQHEGGTEEGYPDVSPPEIEEVRHDDDGGIDCECGAGPFDSEESVQRHREQWHDDDEVKPRTVLVHLNVAVAADDTRDADAIAAFIDAALCVGMEGASDEDDLGDLRIGGIGNVVVALAEEV